MRLFSGSGSSAQCLVCHGRTGSQLVPLAARDPFRSRRIIVSDRRVGAPERCRDARRRESSCAGRSAAAASTQTFSTLPELSGVRSVCERPRRERGDRLAATVRTTRHVCMVAYTDYVGDARVRREAETLAAHGFNVRCLTTRNGGAPREFVLDGVDVSGAAGAEVSRQERTRILWRLISGSWLAASGSVHSPAAARRARCRSRAQHAGFPGVGRARAAAGWTQSRARCARFDAGDVRGEILERSLAAPRSVPRRTAQRR